MIWVGNDRASGVYIGKKKTAAKKIGVDFELYRFPEKISQKELEEGIKKIVKNQENSGIIIQLPLPEKIDTGRILNLIPLQKDIDVLSENSFDKFAQGKSKVVPPTIGAISNILKEYKISLRGKYMVIVGAGRLVGKPLAAWMAQKNGKFSIIDKNTEDLSYFTKKADIVITGVGESNLIKGDMVRKGSAVIDVGGDVDFKSVSGEAGFLTPVLGGVGPLTVACLLDNLVKLSPKK